MAEGPSIAPKRSLFNKPTWAAKSTSAETAERPFFDHRDTTYGDILAQKEKRREKHRARTSAEKTEASGRESKRRRISGSEDSDSDLPSSRHEDSDESKHNVQNHRLVTRSTLPKDGNHTARLNPDHLVKSFSPRKASPSAKPTIVDLSDDEDDAEPILYSPAKPLKFSPSMARPKPPKSDPESEDEDEYTLELKRRVREKAILRKLGLDPQSRTPDPPNTQSQSPQLTGSGQPSSVPFPAEGSSRQSPPPPTPPKKENDTIVRILIRTAITETNDLIVNRRATQTLQQVKEAWCKRQGFDAAKTRKVILTWRGNKLFNTSTCTHILRSLKEERKKSGVASLDSDEEEGDPSKGRIEVEAVTEEILAERKRAREKAEQSRDMTDDDEEQLDEEGGKPEQPKEPEYQLQLKSLGLEPFYLKVRASTLVSKIMAGFKKIRQVEHGKTCWLVFDGERLDPDSKIGDTEIEDGDVVDVQIR